MKKLLPVLAFLGVSCAAVSGPPHSDAWGPFATYYGLRDMEERAGAIVLRGGWFMPSKGKKPEDSFGSTWTAGLAYVKERQRSAIKFLEFGVDYIQPESEDRDSMLFIGRFDLGMAALGGGLYGAYGLAGVHVIIEHSPIPEATIPPTTKLTFWSIDLNVGVGWRSRKLDLRANYIILLTGTNGAGVFVVGAGLYF